MNNPIVTIEMENGKKITAERSLCGISFLWPTAGFTTD